MTSIPSRELRNDVSAVLRRVEAGERLTITVSGREVAELVPLDRRPRFVSWERFASSFERASADPELSTELREALPDTTDDDLPPEW
ncbi:type II toxin-antitoxin system prevent-host-death family antitoxin [uncultured Amnibacterium sp.]|uniref:type II toxin-antitoxin system Phd/YefM family antitoxin n=1 Tax=uncultured Amnibacterium sp. TaxID=1631851 RepID=UPI0035C95900